MLPNNFITECSAAGSALALGQSGNRNEQIAKSSEMSYKPEQKLRFVLWHHFSAFCNYIYARRMLILKRYTFVLKSAF